MKGEKEKSEEGGDYNLILDWSRVQNHKKKFLPWFLSSSHPSLHFLSGKKRERPWNALFPFYSWGGSGTTQTKLYSVESSTQFKPSPKPNIKPAWFWFSSVWALNRAVWVGFANLDYGWYYCPMISWAHSFFIYFHSSC